MPCSGYPTDCGSYRRDENQCWVCGCDWVYADPWWECWGTPSPCTAHSSQYDCEDCGCDWTVPGINVMVNTADVWKDGAELWINIGNVFKRGAEGWENIGDVWKRVF